MKKRMLSLTLALLLCLGVNVPALAADTAAAGQPNTISMDQYTLSAVDAEGSLWMRGLHAYRQAGDGTFERSPSWTKVMDKVRSVCVTDEGRQTAVIKTDGSLWMFTYGDDGKHFTSSKLLDDVAAVSSSYAITQDSQGVDAVYAAIKTDGSLWMWGPNGSGLLGNGTTTDSDTPARILENVSAVSCDSGATAAVKTDGSLWMWGYKSKLPNEYYESFGYQTVPIRVMDDVRTVNCGGYVTTVVKTDGSLWVWGSNTTGQLANPDFDTSERISTPRKVLDDVVSACNSLSACAAIKADGSLWMWGDNGSGQIGNGYTGQSFGDISIYQLTPTKVMSNVAAVTCGTRSTAAVKTDGSIWLWGRCEHLGISGNGEDPYSYKMQTTPVHLTGVTAKVPSTAPKTVDGFSDVFETNYFADSVLWAVDKGITVGTTKTTFSPYKTCTTAQILTFLWRSQGSPEPTGRVNPFTDVQTSDYFYKAALWARENGIISQNSTVFGGSKPCTRSMAVLYIWRASGSPTTQTVGSFTDVAATAPYASAVDWAVAQGVTSGTTKTTFSPDTTCTRAQIATFLYRAFAK